MRLLITGSRGLKHKHVEAVEAAIAEVIKESKESVVIVVGDCPSGADLYAELAYDRINDHYTQYPVILEKHHAKWHIYGAGAGPVRNKEMVAAGADLVLAFFQDCEQNKGTSDCVAQATEAGLKIQEHRLSE